MVQVLRWPTSPTEPLPAAAARVRPLPGFPFSVILPSTRVIHCRTAVEVIRVQAWADWVWGRRQAPARAPAPVADDPDPAPAPPRCCEHPGGRTIRGRCERCYQTWYRRGGRAVVAAERAARTIT